MRLLFTNGWNQSFWAQRKEFFRTQRSFGLFQAFPDWLISACSLAPGKQGVLEIGKHLAKIGHFRDPSALIGFLYDSLGVILHAAPLGHFDTAAVASQLTQRLTNPLQRFQFSAPLNLRGEICWSRGIGGHNELKLESVERDGEVSMNVSGVVEAPTVATAIIIVEDILETLLGSALAIDLCCLLSPIPGSNPSVCLDISPNDTGNPTQMRNSISAGVSGNIFRVPESLTELERRHVQAGDIGRGLERQLRQLCRLMTSAEDRALELRRAAALLLRAGVSTDVGLALTYCFMCLEGVLLDRTATENILSRLVEAVAYRIGTSAADRSKLRREVKDLYDIRSRYVHTGDAGELAWTKPRERSLELVSQVLRREIEEAALT